MTTDSSLDEYVARIEEACGEEKNIIIYFRYGKKDEVIAKILKKAKIERTVAEIIFDLTYKGFPIRLYKTGKAVLKKTEGKEQAWKILAELLL